MTTDTTPETDTRPTLTLREHEVLRGMANGKTNIEIGLDLYISVDTVKTHATRVYTKLGARDRAHAVSLAYKTGLLDAAPVAMPPPQPRPHPVLVRDPRIDALRLVLAHYRQLRDRAPAGPFTRLYDHITNALNTRVGKP